jgi:hypothetical protein
MTSYVIDAVLFVALLLTSLRVGAMYRELKRLRGYQIQYIEVFGQTSRAADTIGEAVRHLGGEGRDVLERLEAVIEEGRRLAARLEAAARPRSEPASAEANRSDEVGTYSRRTVRPGADGDPAAFKNEILKFGSDNRRLEDRGAEAAEGTTPPIQHHAGREFRLAPSVKTLRAAGGTG